MVGNHAPQHLPARLPHGHEDVTGERGRPTGRSWRAFLRTHAQGLLASGTLPWRHELCGHARGSFWCGLPGEAILQPRVPELVDRPDGAQDVALTGIVKEPQQAGRSVPAHGELSKRQ